MPILGGGRALQLGPLLRTFIKLTILVAVRAKLLVVVILNTYMARGTHIIIAEY